jgi:hypothetical protein
MASYQTRAPGAVQSGFSGNYRFRFLAERRADLAILLPNEPPSEIVKLVRSLGIHMLWFSGKDLKGTIQI